MSTESISPASYGYGPLVTECKRRGISRTVAFDLARRGLVDTFMLGSRRMVKIASLESLPDRLPQPHPNPDANPAPRGG